jgi:hypothetical protein
MVTYGEHNMMSLEHECEDDKMNGVNENEIIEGNYD